MLRSRCAFSQSGIRRSREKRLTVRPLTYQRERSNSRCNKMRGTLSPTSCVPRMRYSIPWIRTCLLIAESLSRYADRAGWGAHVHVAGPGQFVANDGYRNAPVCSDARMALGAIGRLPGIPSPRSNFSYHPPPVWSSQKTVYGLAGDRLHKCAWSARAMGHSSGSRHGRCAGHCPIPIARTWGPVNRRRMSARYRAPMTCANHCNASCCRLRGKALSAWKVFAVATHRHRARFHVTSPQCTG